MEKVNLTPENTLAYRLDREMFNDILSCRRNSFEVELLNGTCREHLETVNGAVVCLADELPRMDYGVYFCNGGVFPYALNGKLEFLLFSYRKKKVVVRIKERVPLHGLRFRHQGADAPWAVDAEGDCTIWSLVYYFERLRREEP